MDLPRESSAVCLKVMRLTKPSTYSSVLVYDCEHGESAFLHDYNDGMPRVEEKCLPEHGCVGSFSKSLSLPLSFGEIYLGQIFRCCVSVSNSLVDCALSDVKLKVELLLPSQKIVILTETNIEGESSSDNASLLRGQEIRDLHVVYEVKDIGQHMLICSVFYTINNVPALQPYKKLFKFNAKKPIDVKTNTCSISPCEHLLEASVENLTLSPIIMKQIEAVFDEPNSYDIEQINADLLDPAQSLPLRKQIQPNDSRQYLFRFFIANPHESFGAMLRSAKPLTPRLSLTWRSQMAESARLQTAPIPIQIKKEEHSALEILQCPSQVPLLQPFHVKLKLHSCDTRHKQILIQLDAFEKAEQLGILWHGISNFHVQNFSHTQPVELCLTAFAFKSGTQRLPPFSVVEKTSNYVKRFDAVKEVFVN